MLRRPLIDLATVRETVSYMHDDVARTPGMERIAIAFDQVLREIEAVEQRQSHGGGERTVAARFLPVRL